MARQRSKGKWEGSSKQRAGEQCRSLQRAGESSAVPCIPDGAWSWGDLTTCLLGSKTSHCVHLHRTNPLKETPGNQSLFV